MTDDDAALDAFWRDADLDAPETARAALEALLAARGLDDARTAYERGSLHDSLGEEERAIPLYRDALARGLSGSLGTRATIQLASSLRNVGDASGAIALLQGFDDSYSSGAAAPWGEEVWLMSRDSRASDPLADAARAFLALALFSDEKPTEALAVALQTLAPHLPRYARAVNAYAGALVKPDRVRAISVGLLVREGRVLLELYPANARHGEFLRAPGGGIEFGETAADAVRRELAEELDATVDEARLLAVTENIFDGPAGRGHEIVHVFAVESAQLAALPPGGRIAVRDSHTTVGWYEPAALRAGSLPAYPVGILDLAETLL
ncbi:tetratricopeptide repeat protein [Microbacterium sp.]|uniref:tetratricopeptide repeat protein n=1 Tax=Microbacterium sp. TaxID=51671 RepID=UPI003C77F3EA